MPFSPFRLGDVLRPVRRKVLVAATDEYRLLGVRLDGRGPFLREIKSGSQISTSTVYAVEPGDFIYSRLFAWRGAFGVIDNSLSGCVVSSEFPTFLPIDDGVEVNYLKYWFRLRPTLIRVEANCSGSTPLTRNRYKENFFLDMEISLPSIKEQRRIVAKIERLVSKVEDLRQLRKTVCETGQALLRSVFRDLTKSAERKPMSLVAPIVRRPVSIDPREDYFELGIRSFGRGTFPKAGVSGIDIGNKRLYSIEPGDLIFHNVFAWEGAIAVAAPHVRGRVGSHRYITCVPDPAIATAEFLRFFSLTPEGLDLIGQASPGGALRNRTLGLRKLEKIDVPTPDVKEQRWFDGLQEKFDNIISQQRTSDSELDAFLPSIFDHAFRGEL